MEKSARIVLNTNQLNRVMTKKQIEAMMAKQKEASKSTPFLNTEMGQYAYQLGFEDGVDHALSHLWVRVEDELPKDKQNMFITLADGRSTSGWYSHTIEEWFISVGEIGGDDCLYEHVTHWMPIPPLAAEGGEKK